MSKVPKFAVGRLVALALLTGAGGVYFAQQPVNVPVNELQQAQADPYLRAVAADTTTSLAVKAAMVLGHFYESSGRHIGTPYIDKLGRGQPLTVCNGITGAGVVAGRHYSPADCYQLERGRYQTAERQARTLLQHWDHYDALARATFIDFIHNKGAEALRTSTMRRKANAGDLVGACRENPRWSRGTVNGMLIVLPGLLLRGESNDELCRDWRLEMA